MNSRRDLHITCVWFFFFFYAATKAAMFSWWPGAFQFFRQFLSRDFRLVNYWIKVTSSYYTEEIVMWFQMKINQLSIGVAVTPLYTSHWPPDPVGENLNVVSPPLNDSTVSHYAYSLSRILIVISARTNKMVAIFLCCLACNISKSRFEEQ